MQTRLNEARKVLRKKQKGGGRDVEAQVWEERARAGRGRGAGSRTTKKKTAVGYRIKKWVFVTTLCLIVPILR